MSRIVIRVGIGIAAIAALLIALTFFIDANRFKPALEEDLSKAVGRAVKLGDLKLAIFSGGITADDLSIADDARFSTSPFVRAKSLHAEVDLLPLIFSRQLNIRGLTIDQPEIVLLQAPSGAWNFSSLGSKNAAPSQADVASSAGSGLSLKQMSITNGRFTLGRTGGHWTPLVLEQVKITTSDFSTTSVFPFSLATNIAGGGAIKLDGKAGPIDQADVSRTPVSAALNVSQLDLAGPALSNIAPGIAGMASLDGSAQSDGKVVRLNGKLKAEKLKLAKNGHPANSPVQFDYAVEHDLGKHSGALRRGDIQLGRVPASLTGTYGEEGNSLALRMSLTGEKMAIPELVSLLPALGVVLPAGSTLEGGTLSVKLSLDGPVDKLVTAGPAVISDTKLAGFDLGRKMSAIAALAGLPASGDTQNQAAEVNLHAAPDGVNLQNIRVVVPQLGELSGGGLISPANALNFKMNAVLHTAVLPTSLNTSIPFTVEGSSADPIFRPDLHGVASQQIKGLENKAATEVLKSLLGGKKSQ